MPRIVKSAEDRRDEILDVAQHLFAEQGYAHTSVRSIIDAVGIAKGTFYHHFKSKSDLLDALVMRLIDEVPAVLAPIVDDPEMDAVAKYSAFFARLNAWKLQQRRFMLEVGRTLQDDANVRLLQRLRAAGFESYRPFLVRIIEEGVEEGLFDTRFPEQTASIISAILESMRNPIWHVLNQPPHPEAIEELEAILDAHSAAIERVLGATEGSLQMFDRAGLRPWLEQNAERGAPAPDTDRRSA